MKSIGRREMLVGMSWLAAGLALQGCRDEEQGRILYFRKGEYLGEPDSPLTEEQLRALRRRAAEQSV